MLLFFWFFFNAITTQVTEQTRIFAAILVSCYAHAQGLKPNKNRNCNHAVRQTATTKQHTTQPECLHLKLMTSYY